MRMVRLGPVLLLSSLVAPGSARPASETLAPETLSAETSRPESSTFAAGEPVTLTFRATGLGPGKTERMTIAIRDDRGVEVAALSPVLTGDGQGNAVFEMAAPHERLGYYEVSASLEGGATIAALGTRPAGRISYAVVPDPGERPDYGPARTRFAMQGGFHPRVNVIPLLGFRYYIPGTYWAKWDNAAPGEFVRQRAQAKARGMVWPPRFEDQMRPQWNGRAWRVYPIGQVVSSAVPDWARVPGTEGTVCRKFGAINAEGRRRLPDYAAAYARALVEDNPDLRPRIYQITWEPAAGWCYNGSAEQLVEFFRLTYPAIHKADPDALVVGPTLYPNPSSTAQISGLWKAGLGKYIDGFSLHASAWDNPPETHGIPGELRKQLAEGERIARRRFVLVSTEHGTHSKVLGNRGKAAVDTRIALTMLGEGAVIDTAFYIADYFDPREGPAGPSLRTQGFYWNLNASVGAGSDRLAPKMSVPSYAAMTRLIDGSDSRGTVPGLHGTQAGYRFVRGRTAIDAVWDYGGSSTFAVAKGATLCDWMGNCGPAAGATTALGDVPVYIVSSPQAE